MQWCFAFSSLVLKARMKKKQSSLCKDLSCSSELEKCPETFDERHLRTLGMSSEKSERLFVILLRTFKLSR